MNASLMIENVTWIKSGIALSIDVSMKIKKNIMWAKNVYSWNPATYSCENSKYAGSVIGDSYNAMK